MENIESWVSLSTENEIVTNLFEAFGGIAAIAKAVSEVVGLFA